MNLSTSSLMYTGSNARTEESVSVIITMWLLQLGYELRLEGRKIERERCRYLMMWSVTGGFWLSFVQDRD